jgi:hypothetical protein
VPDHAALGLFAPAGIFLAGYHLNMPRLRPNAEAIAACVVQLLFAWDITVFIGPHDDVDCYGLSS